MPVTRSDLQKSIEVAKNNFGIEIELTDPLIDQPTLNRVYKRRINQGRNSGLSWVDINKEAYLLLKHSVYLQKDKNEDWLFSDMIDQSTLDVEGNILKLELQGLKSVCHARLCNVLLKRFLQKSKTKNVPDIDIKIENIPIPYNPLGKGLVVPPLRIVVKSFATSIQLSLMGNSSMVFVLYHLKKILQIFLMQLPLQIDECYSFPSQSSNSSKTNEKSDDHDKMSQEDADVAPAQLSPSQLSSGQSSPIIRTQRSKWKMQIHGNENVKTSTGGGKEYCIVDEEENCPECVLISIANNMTVLVSANDMKVHMECDASCLRVKDSMEAIVNGFFNLVVDLKTLKMSTMVLFKKNFRCLSRYVLSKAGGSYTFFRRVLEKFMDLDTQRKNRIIRLLNEITDICINGNVKAFEEQLLKSKDAKRNLTLFLYETGAISSIHAVLNLFHKMHNAGVNILLVLPTFLSSVVDELLEVPPPQTNKSHHQSINEISRKFVQRILKEQNIAVLKISNKMYIPEKLEVFGDSFVYFDKNEKMLSHFLEIKDKINSNCIPLDHLMYDEKENSLESDDWKFVLQSDWKPVQLVINKQSNLDAREVEQHSQNENDFNLSKSDVGDLDSSFDSLKEEATNAVIETAFLIEKDELLKYWNPVSLETRKFHAHLVGEEWPSRYKSVCCISLDYNRAKKYKSRKRNEKFAKVVGICTICQATHTYIISDNPFEEIPS